MNVWRPAPAIRVKALGLHWRDGRLLAFEVHDDAGRVTGVRPLGGSIEFGETAEAALRREFREELGIDVVVAGDYPGDGKPKPVAFPDPSAVAVRGERVALVPIEKLIELKIASGASAPHRLKDLADVLELVRSASLRRELSDSLDPSVRAKYLELWDAAQTRDED